MQFLARHRLLRRTLIALAFLAAASGWFLRPDLLRELRRPNQQAPMVEDVLDLIRRHYTDSLGDDDLSFRAVKGILKSLPDPYSTLLASGDLKRYRDLLEGTAGEAGLVLLEGPLGLTVGEVVSRSPAAEKGIRAGDRILEIEGARTEAWTAPRGEQALRGEPGSTVTLVTRRPGLADSEHFTMRRERVRVLAPATRLFTPSVGYIRLTSVSRGSTQALEAEVTRLVHQGARGVVLDLRNNPGGLLNEATALLDLFLDRGAPIGAVESRGRQSVRPVTAGAQQRWPGLKVVVLVNAATASAAEIIAAALKENHRALVVGQRTFGKGLIQTTMRLGPDLAMRISIARWLTPDGRQLDGTTGRSGGPRGGVEPDIVVAPWRPGPGDEELRRVIGTRREEFRLVLEQAIQRGEWAPPPASTETTRWEPYRGLARRLREAHFRIEAKQLAAGNGLLAQEYAILAVVGAEVPVFPARPAVLPDTQLMTALRFLEDSFTTSWPGLHEGFR